MKHSTREQYEIHVIVRGEVQGVGFRATTCHYARQLGLKGTVRNLEEGSVEIYAQGPKKELEELIRLLKQEAGFGRVEEAVVELSSVVYFYQDFRIIK